MSAQRRDDGRKRGEEGKGTTVQEVGLRGRTSSNVKLNFIPPSLNTHCPSSFRHVPIVDQGYSISWSRLCISSNWDLDAFERDSAGRRKSSSPRSSTFLPFSPPAVSLDLFRLELSVWSHWKLMSHLFSTPFSVSSKSTFGRCRSSSEGEASQSFFGRFSLSQTDTRNSFAFTGKGLCSFMGLGRHFP